MAEVTGLLLKRVRRNVLSLASDEEFSDWLYELQWRSRPRQIALDSGLFAGPGNG